MQAILEYMQQVDWIQHIVRTFQSAFQSKLNLFNFEKLQYFPQIFPYSAYSKQLLLELAWDQVTSRGA